MISPKYSLTHYYHSAKALAAKLVIAPHVVNLYLDYNCPFSAKIYFKLEKVIPELQKKHPGEFQFVFVNVVQPWHPNSVLLHEYALVVAQLLRATDPERSNGLFWSVSEALFHNKEQFYDSATVYLGRNDIYKKINDVVFETVDLPLRVEDVLERLEISSASDPTEASNGGNDATVDVKYFTRYLRGVGIHVTPTVSVDGIVNDSISSGTEVEKLIEIFETYL
ncbi:CIC11C00000005011 [Sungouiella intermedia]|uniref:CIC11C00000005011 n=1 Tax=Sungouiella intermedia TaxID=45354 RepID=A0A1L0BR94_9ASCO|nr:CIC11C00000005011 [[Candida] intermedia]